MSDVMMKCGHAANSKDAEGNPCCVICIGIHAGAREVMPSPPLEGRKARCIYDRAGKQGPSWGGISENGYHCVQDSKVELPFFEHRPGQPYDYFYCGCFGWD